MIDSLALFFAYILRIIPGVMVGCFLLYLLKKQELAIRIVIYIAVFILIRDAITPLGFWKLGSEGGLWVRFIPDSFLLIMLGLGSLMMVPAMNLYDSEARALLVWFKGSSIAGILVGIAAAGIVVLPVAALYLFVPIENRGGEVMREILPALLIMTMLGNFYEETLFRGYLQGYLERSFSGPWWKPALMSGVAFGFGHTFLALTVTDAGVPLLAFTIWEGVMAGLVRAGYGIIPATLTHGLAIFLLAGGFF